MTETQSIVCAMFDRMLIQFGRFTLKDGRTSPVYVNLRPLPSYPILLEQVAKEMLRKVHTDQFLGTRFAGLPMSGVPLAVAMGLIGKIPVLYPRQQPPMTVEGDYKPEDHVIVVDDVLTDGAIKRWQIETIRKAGLNVRDLIVVVDRDEGGTQAMAADRVRVHSLTTLREAVQCLREHADLSDHYYHSTLAYLDQGKAV